VRNSNNGRWIMLTLGMLLIVATGIVKHAALFGLASYALGVVMGGLFAPPASPSKPHDCTEGRAQG
jgi:hypothetical protein